MEKSRKKIAFLVWLVLLAALPGPGAVAQTLIANQGLALDSLTEDTVRAVFTMRLRRWSDGSPVRVFVLPDRHPTHRAFSKKLLGVFPHQLRRAWDRMVFSGTGQAPTEVADEEEMIERVATTPGAVGYVEADEGDKRVLYIPVE